MKNASGTLSLFSLIVFVLVTSFFLAGPDATATILVLPNYAETNQIANNAEAIFTDILREQTVYSASEFPAYPVLITAIHWRPDVIVDGPISTTISNIQVNLSTCTKGADHLDTVFAQNTGVDDKMVFNGAMLVNSSFTTLSNGTKVFDIDLPLQTPFLFDSSQGNLLIDIRNFTGCIATLFDNGAPNLVDAVSRIYNSSSATAVAASSADSGGGIIQISYVLSPLISSQPSNQTIAVGSTAVLTSTAIGPPPLSYQWFFNDLNAPVNGATNSSLLLTNVQPAQAGNYFVQVSNPNGATTSSNATLAIILTPTIILQPTSQIIPVGDTAVFSVTATGFAPLAYQWFFNSTNLISGATNSTLSITNVQIPQLGTYSIEVTNIYGSVDSLIANLTLGVVLPNYAVSNQVANNGEALFTSILREQAIYKSTEFPAYPIIIRSIHWRPDAIAGGPVATIISNIQVNLSTCAKEPDHLDTVFTQNTGMDDTVVFSGVMNVNSAFVTLSNGTKAFDIDLPLQTPFLLDPSRGNLLIDIRNFTGCNTPLFNNAAANAADATSRIFNSSSATATDASSGDTGGGVIQIGYIPAPLPPDINSQPTNQTVVIGDNAAFAVTVSGPSPLSYQWFFNDTNTPVNRATNSFLLLTNVQPSQVGSYFIQVSDLFGSTLSSNALLNVTVVPTIVSQPNDEIVSDGDTAVFAVAAAGLGPLAYQWFFNGTNLVSDATNSTLSITNVQIPQLGVYSVEVSNTYGSIESLSANLTFGFVVPNYAVSNQVANNGEAIFTSIVREQAIYKSTDFPSYPIIIRAIRWRPDVIAGGPISTTISNIQVNLSTCTKGPDHLDMIFALNTGTDDTMVFSGVMNVSSSFATLSNGTKAFDIDLPLQTPFLFDPLQGNLLIDIRNFTGCSASLFNNAAANPVDSTSRIYNPSSPTATTASTADTGGGVIQVGYIPAPVPPIISFQPTNRTATVGGVAMFSVAAGPPPLSYQWFFNTNNPVDGATNSSLLLTNVQPGQAGAYSVQIVNAYGSTNSANAFLTVVVPPATIRLGTTNSMGGNSFDVPVILAANGNENALNFSLNFDTQRLAYASVALGSNAPDAALLANTSQTGNGRLGISLQLPPNETFAVGTQEVARVTFNSAILLGTQPVTTPVNFTNQPINKLLFDALGNKLATNFVNGSVTISPSVLEGDVTPRTTGDQSLDIFDWSEVGRMVAGLDVVSNSSEFQRADCAPKSTSGDGQLKVTDWVQAGRYGSATDLPAAIGGPVTPVSPTVLTGGPRALSISAGTTANGIAVTLPVILQSHGDESALGFSVNFDPTILKYTSIAKGSAAASATLIANTNQANSGIVGVLVALPSGNFASGTQEIVRLNFMSLATTTNNAVTFVDQPVIRAVSDSAANELAANYTNSTVTVNPPPTLSISFTNGSAILSWPAWATGFNLQGSLDDLLAPGWTNVSSSTQTNGNNISVTVPAQKQEGYFRLQHP